MSIYYFFDWHPEEQGRPQRPRLVFFPNKCWKITLYFPDWHPEEQGRPQWPQLVFFPNKLHYISQTDTLRSKGGLSGLRLVIFPLHVKKNSVIIPRLTPWGARAASAASTTAASRTGDTHTASPRKEALLYKLKNRGQTLKVERHFVKKWETLYVKN